jgi:hypothetical protein
MIIIVYYRLIKSFFCIITMASSKSFDYPKLYSPQEAISPASIFHYAGIRGFESRFGYTEKITFHQLHLLSVMARIVGRSRQADDNYEYKPTGFNRKLVYIYRQIITIWLIGPDYYPQEHIILRAIQSYGAGYEHTEENFIQFTLSVANVIRFLDVNLTIDDLIDIEITEKDIRATYFDFSDVMTRDYFLLANFTCDEYDYDDDPDYKHYLIQFDKINSSSIFLTEEKLVELIEKHKLFLSMRHILNTQESNELFFSLFYLLTKLKF